MFEEGMISDVNYYSDKNCKIGTIKNCTIRNEFTFCRTDFILLSKVLNYYVCVFKDGELLSVWSCPIDGTNKSEAMSKFRDGMSRNHITKDMIDIFIEKPVTFKRRYKSNHINTK